MADLISLHISFLFNGPKSVPAMEICLLVRLMVAWQCCRENLTLLQRDLISPCCPSPFSGGALRNSSGVRLPPALRLAVSPSADSGVSHHGVVAEDQESVGRGHSVDVDLIFYFWQAQASCVRW